MFRMKVNVEQDNDSIVYKIKNAREEGCVKHHPSHVIVRHEARASPNPLLWGRFRGALAFYLAITCKKDAFKRNE
jgi:hypothetical protein